MLTSARQLVVRLWRKRGRDQSLERPQPRGDLPPLSNWERRAGELRQGDRDRGDLIIELIACQWSCSLSFQHLTYVGGCAGFAWILAKHVAQRAGEIRVSTAVYRPRFGDFPHRP